MRYVLGLVGMGIGIIGFLISSFTSTPTNALELPLPSPSFLPSEPVGTEASAQRVQNGLVALYNFHSASGPIIKDRSGVGRPVDLRIENLNAVRRSEGSLEVVGKTVIRSEKTPSRIIDAIRKSGEITVEAWIRPANTKQDGPARIVTISHDTSNRNFTLGQERDRFDARLRTTRTSGNGLPSLSTPNRSLDGKLTHVVYTRERSGQARIFLNGKQKASKRVSGNTSNWNRSYRLALANELTKNRTWLGKYHLVAIYDRDLSAKEVEQNYRAGVQAQIELVKAIKQRKAESARLFKSKITHLLARHCLECHGWKSKRGRLDLSRKSAALQGNHRGKVIVPGRSAESRLWKSVQTNDMPKNRSPLSKREKALLQQWIDKGAVWSVETISPALYAKNHNNVSTFVRRLTVNEYIETVKSAVGVDVAENARKILPPDLRADGFSNTAYNLTVDLEHVEGYAKLARLIVPRMDVVKFAGKFSKRKDLSEQNMRQVIRGMGNWLFRGPLNDEEINSFLQISKAVAKEDGKFKEAVSFIVEAMLQSPRFIYLMENQVGDGNSRPVSSYELASRLSYIIWGGPPDEDLLQAADKGTLKNRDRVREQVDRMFKDPRAIHRSRQFLAEWLNLNRLQNLQPNRKRFPNWGPELAEDQRKETLAFFEDVVWKQNRPLSDLLNAQFTYLTPRLAKHYGLKPMGPKGTLTRYDLSSTPSRGGLLTHGSVLTIGGDDASMVARGLFVLHDLLDSEVGDPPPCVDTTPVPTKPGLSQRGISLVRLANPNCTGCHSKFEPLAFGLEKFDGLGSYNEIDDHGNKLREDGEILFPGEDKAVQYKTSAELMNLLAKSRRVRECITRKITQFALGRPLVEADDPILEEIHRSVQQHGGTYQSVITAIVMSDLVQKTRTEEKK